MVYPTEKNIFAWMEEIFRKEEVKDIFQTNQTQVSETKTKTKKTKKNNNKNKNKNKNKKIRYPNIFGTFGQISTNP